MSNLPVPIQNELSTLNTLSLQEIYNAFFARVPIRGFYISDMGVDASKDDYCGLKNISLIHAKTGMRIDLDRDGKVEVKV